MTINVYMKWKRCFFSFFLATVSRAVRWSLAVLTAAFTLDKSPGFLWPLLPTGRSKWTGTENTSKAVTQNKAVESGTQPLNNLNLHFLLFLIAVLPSTDRLWPALVAARPSLTLVPPWSLAQPLTSTTWILGLEPQPISTEMWVMNVPHFSEPRVNRRLMLWC